MKQKLLVILLIISMLIPSNQSVTADEGPKILIESRYAEVINALGILTGSGSDLMLNKPLKRSESSVIIIRLLGGADEAKSAHYSHPFKDVPTWGNDYVGYLWEKGVSKGIGNGKFGSDQLLDGYQYITLLLRILGYSDVKGDFKVSDALIFANEMGMLSKGDLAELEMVPFTRYHAAKYAFKALNMNVKNSKETLLDRLVRLNSITTAQLKQATNLGWKIDKNSDGYYKISYNGIFIEDKNLEKAIRISIDYPTGVLTTELLQTVKYIIANNSNIRSLEGINHLVNLDSLYFEANHITDLSPLSDLRNLTSVNLSYNDIKDTEALKYLAANSKLETLLFQQATPLTYKYNLQPLVSIKGAVIYANATVNIMGETKKAKSIEADLKGYQPSGKIDYLILLDNAQLVSSIDAFYQLKKSQGYHVWVEYVSNVTKDISRDQPEIIKDYLSAMEEKNDLKYVLLIGNPYDPDNVTPQHTGGSLPMKYVYICDPNNFIADGTSAVYKPSTGYMHQIGNVPSDNYYAYTGIWDADDQFYINANNVNSLNIDNCNLFAIGRIPFSDPENVSKVLAATIHVETKQLSKKTLLAGGLLSIPDLLKEAIEPSADTSNHMEIIKKRLLSNKYAVDTMYEHGGIKPSVNKSTKDLTAENINQVYSGYDSIFFSGHGGIQSLVWDKDTNKNGQLDGDEASVSTFFNINQVSGLVPFILMEGCSTAVVERVEESRNLLYQETDIIALMLQGKIAAGVGTGRDVWIDTKIEGDSIISSFDITQKGLGMGDYITKMINSRYNKIKEQDNYYSVEPFLYNYYGDPSMKLYN